MTIKDKSHFLEYDIRACYIGKSRYNYMLFEVGIGGARNYCKMDITSTIKKKDVKILITIDHDITTG